MGLHQMERLVRPLSILGSGRVHCNSLASFLVDRKPDYRDDYLEFWRYAWDHFVDHQHGAWFRILSREGQKIDRLKSPPGKTDFICPDSVLGYSGSSVGMIHPMFVSWSLHQLSKRKITLWKERPTVINSKWFN